MSQPLIAILRLEHYRRLFDPWDLWLPRELTSTDMTGRILAHRCFVQLRLPHAARMFSTSAQKSGVWADMTLVLRWFRCIGASSLLHAHRQASVRCMHTLHLLVSSRRGTTTRWYIYYEHFSPRVLQALSYILLTILSNLPSNSFGDKYKVLSTHLNHHISSRTRSVRMSQRAGDMNSMSSDYDSSSSSNNSTCAVDGDSPVCSPSLLDRAPLILIAQLRRADCCAAPTSPRGTPRL